MRRKNILNTWSDRVSRRLPFGMLFVIIYQILKNFLCFRKFRFLVFDSKTFFHRTTLEIGYIPFDREFDSTHSYVKKSKTNVPLEKCYALETLSTMILFCNRPPFEA